MKIPATYSIDVENFGVDSEFRHALIKKINALLRSQTYAPISHINIYFETEFKYSEMVFGGSFVEVFLEDGVKFRLEPVKPRQYSYHYLTDEAFAFEWSVTSDVLPQSSGVVQVVEAFLEDFGLAQYDPNKREALSSVLSLSIAKRIEIDTLESILCVEEFIQLFNVLGMELLFAKAVQMDKNYLDNLVAKFRADRESNDET